MKSSKRVYFINIRLFSRIFCKNIFIGCYDKNTVFSVRSGTCQDIDIRHQNNSRNNIFFKTAVKTSKAKDFAANKSNVILCDKCFGN